ncbi:MAG: 2Fe-2S iron-sulfur cluster-binding protein [Sphingobium sp.]
MVQVYFIEADGAERVVTAEPGASVMNAARDNMIAGIDGDCGGMAACATCHIYVDPDWIGKVGMATDETELALLEFTDAAQTTSRLSCQIILSDDLDGLTVRLPAYQF